MARYNRINLDGKSDTKMGIVTAETLPGKFMYYDDSTGKFVIPDAATALQKYYVANRSQLSVNVEDAIAAGDSVNAEVLSSNRELAGYVAVSQTVLEDSPLTLTTGGSLAVATGTDVVVGWASEALTTDASDEQLIKFVAA